MQLLALETSTELGSCALWRNGEVIERRCPPGRPHSETLLPLLQDLLWETGVTVGALDGIAFGAGPGAFTGLRVACALTQGLAVASNIPVVPVCTLAALAWQSGAECCLALLDARMGEVYAAAYRRGAGRMEQESEIYVSRPEDVVLPRDSGWQAAGNALLAYPGLAQRVEAAGFVAQPHLLPLASGIAALAAPVLLAGEGMDAALAAPLYVRDKVAQTVAERLAQGGKA